MAFQFRGVDADGTVYPEAYAKAAFLKVDRRAGVVESWFNNYPDVAARNAPASGGGFPGVVGRKYGQTTYRIAMQPLGAVLTYGGPPLNLTVGPDSTTEERVAKAAADAALAALAAMGISVDAGGTPSHDGVGALDEGALAAMGVTVLDPPVPGYMEYFGSVAATVDVVNSLIANHIASHPVPVSSATTQEVFPDGVREWRVLYVDHVKRTVFIETDDFRNADTMAANRPCGTTRYAVAVADYDTFLASTAADGAAAIDAMEFDFARGRRPYRDGGAVDVHNHHGGSSEGSLG